MSAIMPTLSTQLRRPLQAGDHRDAHQVVARQRRVGGDPAHLVAEARLLGRVGRLEIALVLDRVLLHVFERHQPALPVVAVELGVARLAAPHAGEPLGEIDRVVDAAVHPHAAERIVDVGGVAGEKRAADPERLRHPLVHAVERHVHDVVVAHGRLHGRERLLGECAARRRLVGHLGRDRKHHPPHAGDLQIEVPLGRIGHVAHRVEPGHGRVEVERGADHQEALRPGEALELDVERLAHLRARAVGADQPAPAPLFACRRPRARASP